MHACAYPMCKALLHKGRWCSIHTPTITRDYKREDQYRGTRQERGYGANHQRWRLMVLARCPMCIWPGCTAPATEADHIIPLSKGGSWALDNGQGMCKRHHARKTRQDNNAGEVT